MVLKIGHRGAKGYAPENTLFSFKKALDCNVDIVNFDVRSSRCKKLVVFRHSYLNSKLVSRSSFRRLRSLDVGGNKPMPTLKEVFDFGSNSVVYLISVHDRRSVRRVVSLINRYVKKYGWSYDNFMIESSNRSRLRLVRRLSKKISLVYSSVLPFGVFSFMKKYSIGTIIVHHQFLGRIFIRKAHNRNLKVFVAIVNSKPEIEYFKSSGVDGIVSDYPDII